ncbi:glycoside hydrolase family 16 protein [Hahella sp. HN01]|uniref:glycoside hydrolase family 16 protein n=1 Tax=Hahella sp. HN01 TaxID=2847262 RepID=UPI001C1EE5C7|nr:glycoside hydrolase family 16 protein [Hahella sp. HN01]MBU6951172.1 glycoside hydrolase family 16 protein [Hahella sp. HN01]
MKTRTLTIGALALGASALLAPTTFAAAYNAGVAAAGFDAEQAQTGVNLHPYAELRNLRDTGIFTLYVDVMKQGQESPAHSFQCRTPELASRAQFRCDGDFQTDEPGAYFVRARAGSIQAGDYFNGNSRYPGQQDSATLTLAEPEAPVDDLIIDAFGDASRYEGLHQNLLGGWTDDDGSLQSDQVSNGALRLISGGGGYWYSVLATDTCFDASPYTHLKLSLSASQRADLSLSLHTRDDSCSTRQGASQAVTVTVEPGAQEVLIPLKDFQLADLSKVHALVADHLQSGVEYDIADISLVSRDDNGDGDGDDNGDPDPGVPQINDEFTANQGQWYSRRQPNGAVDFGAADAAAGDNAALSLLFPGNPDLNSGDNASPYYASEVGYNQKTHYGRYETRVKFASCSPGEEAVNGIFIYDNDGTDKNGNGLADNTEIDIELLCGEPNILWLTTWTDYGGDSENQFRKKSRAIDMATGAYRETPAGMEGTYETVPAGALPNIGLADFPHADTYYTVGFDWHADRIRWYIKLDGKEVTLWDMRDAAMVPQRPAIFMLNLWHSPWHWFDYGPADYPAANAEMKVDYYRFTPF